jgi:uncharacterized protein YbjT (DUF2867 family)
MKIVVVGGSGLIGSKVVAMLRHGGHDVLAASRRSGVDVVSGEGLTDAVQGASVVVDVTNAPSFEDAAVMKFSRPQRTTCSRQKLQQASHTTSRYLWSAPNVCCTVATSARNSRRRS